MRIWVVCLGSFIVAACAQADRIINVPTARNLPVGTIKFEYSNLANGTSATNRYLAFTPIKGMEFELHNHNGGVENGKVTTDFSYNLIAPVSSVSPGISVGVLDALNETSFGSRGFFALSFRELLNVGATGAHGEVTLGIQFGRKNSGFVGANIPLSKSVHLLADHNGYVLAAGLEVQLQNCIKLRALTQESALYFGFSLSQKL